MALRRKWLEGLNNRSGMLKGYCSILGLKIAVSVGSFMLFSILGYIFFHEYQHEGTREIYAILTSPFLWGGVITVFAALMVVLSKVVILPLKWFELHISELEDGKKTDPFVLNRKDEIGYLADRFNSLHKAVMSKIEERDIQLSVLYNFTNAASGIFDIPSLMDNFFNILSTAVDLEIGAYVISHKNHTEGRIYSAFENLGEKEASEITKGLVARAAHYCHGFPKDKIGSLGVTRINVNGRGAGVFKDGSPTHFIELPLMCRAEPIGVISLISYSSAGVEPVLGSKVFSAMVRHTNTVIEKLLTHIFAEEKRLSNILSSMSEGVYIIDKDGHATSINKKGMELVSVFCNNNLECVKKGYETGLGACPMPEPCEFSGIINRVRGFSQEFEGKVYTEEIKNKNGTVFQLSISELRTEDNRKEGYVITAKDITEDRLIQKRVLLSSKLAALGEMAAGIAHEVNNPLQVMMANIELLEANVNEKGHRRLENLKDGIMRIKGIVRDLLIFAREQTTEVEDIDINTVIQKVADILGHQLKVANVVLELDLDRRSLLVRCNKNLFQQVIINLLQNAKDAIEESRKGSRVYIRTVLLPGGIVVVEVSDDGPGIPENIIDRIFDPFFTTKDVGKGTGLGLSVSRRILESMGGNISACSSPKTGTTFTITLLHNRTARRKEDRMSPCEIDYSRLSDKSAIIVDDEEGMLRAVKESIGSKVAVMDSSMDGKEALEKLMDRDYDIILLDIKMPGMNGMELYRNINENKPYLAQRIIFLTGDTENESTESFLKLTGCRYLSKPFTMKELLNVMCAYEMEMR